MLANVAIKGQAAIKRRKSVGIARDLNKLNNTLLFIRYYCTSSKIPVFSLPLLFIFCRESMTCHRLNL